ncbi:MAG: hypothetical protein F4227_04225 [Gammaproteobacteria bacterium]|nr:hypothetical protein [Gammaproteobacteria bacterium]MYF02182.1 hypothetical protein [Gammaproteobacteria bacterium]MYI76683.1 hypothetical protein [Gammaproteobacteria bacterium]
MTARRLIWICYFVGMAASPLLGQEPSTDENSDPERQALPIQTNSISLKYQGFEINEQSIQPTGGARTGTLPDYDTIIAQFWGAGFDFDEGDKDADGALTELELLNLFLEHSLQEAEANAWATLLFYSGDINKDDKVSDTELMVIHYAPLLEHQIKEGFLNDGSTHVQITLDDESLTDFVNTFAYFVATLRVEGHTVIETDILSLDLKIELDPLYFDQKLLPNLSNKAAFDLTSQTVELDGKRVAMGINLCLFELNCIVRVGRFDADDDLALSEREWENAQDTIFPNDENLLSMTQDDETFGLSNDDRTPTFQNLDENNDAQITIAEIVYFVRESMADFGDVEL